MEESLNKELVTNVFDLLKFFFSHLTENLLFIFALVFCSLFTLALLFYVLKPILAFFIKPLLNRNQKKQDRIINDENLENGLCKKVCSKEKEVLYIQDITKCRNRRLALFFFGLTKLTKNKISPTHFERLYGYLVIEKDDIKISNNMILFNNIVYGFFAFFFFVLTSIFWYLFYVSSLSFYRIILLIQLLIFVIPTLYFLSRIIRKREKEDFLKVKDAFLEKLLPEL
ncbi:hypothetical protein A9G11_03575 [Gilliamella sp. wkB108]|uniref:hypothetical protein n=1 Tax=Gilliamella sp. wkB108 TaxID=3120256 RepID=UPI00080DBCE6|nr:hypothetical protein [Gilliamella apicola]OCG24746.1 hypothetical protein A9G11_03575 [Gilliamella apicola]